MVEHLYKILIKWTGNVGSGTANYRAYERSFSIICEKKPELHGSSDPAFRGDPTKWNPEELLLSSLSSCHMLWYLHLCSDNKIVVTDYADRPAATMIVDSSGSGHFKEVKLQPVISITDSKRLADAERLHHEAHQKCFIANSVNFPVKILPSIIAK